MVLQIISHITGNDFVDVIPSKYMNQCRKGREVSHALKKQNT